MNSISAANQEEAANITSEFISSLDNLPAEVQHLLAEIRHREIKSQEIQAEIQKESTRYIRYALKPRENKDGSETPGGTPGANGNSGSNGNGNNKDPQNARRGLINHCYAVLDHLAGEKIALASRLVGVLNRVNARLDLDLKKVVALGVGGELTVEGLLAGMSGGVGGLGISAGANSMMGEHVEVKNGYVVSVPIPPALGEINAALAEENGMGLKRRRVTPSASLTRGSSPMGASGTVGGVREGGGRGHTPLARSRQSMHLHSQHHRTSGRRAAAAAAALAAAVEDDDEGEEDEDAEGEEGEGEGEDDEDDEDGGEADKTLYCFCQKLSFGEMIACDNAKCQYQWFHLGCVGLKPPLPDTWICSDCERRMEAGERPQLVVEAAPQSQSTGRGRKGRRK